MRDQIISEIFYGITSIMIAVWYPCLTCSRQLQCHLTHWYLKLCTTACNSLHYAVHQFLGGVQASSIHFSLRYLQRKKSEVVKSRECGGQGMLIARKIKQPENIPVWEVILCLAMMAIAPSCWNHIVTCGLKARILEREGTFIAKLQHGKHVMALLSEHLLLCNGR
jgi:hypothetical protein